MDKLKMINTLKSNPGVKITHILFDKSEYIYMGNDGNVYDENGYLFEDWTSIGRCDGIRCRTGGYWENGWSIKI